MSPEESITKAINKVATCLGNDTYHQGAVRLTLTYLRRAAQQLDEAQSLAIPSPPTEGRSRRVCGMCGAEMPRMTSAKCKHCGSYEWKIQVAKVTWSD